MNKIDTSTITNKATYLAFVANWKENYAAHSQEIREARAAYNEAQAAFGHVGPYNWGMGIGQEANAAWNAAHKVLEQARATRKFLRLEAQAMLAIRADMKVESARRAQHRYHRADCDHDA